MKHRVAEVDTARRQRAPRKVVTRKQRRSVLWVAQGQVEEYALDDQEYANGCDHDADAGHDPVHVLATSPAEDEQPDRHEEGHEERGNETPLWRAETVRQDRGVHAVVDVDPVPCDAEDDADGYAQERQAHLA